MQLAKPLRKSPRDIANALIAALPKSNVVEKVEIAGAGFINVSITKAAKQEVVRGVLQEASNYGRIDAGAGKKGGRGVRLRQSDWPASCRPWSRRGSG